MSIAAAVLRSPKNLFFSLLAFALCGGLLACRDAGPSEAEAHALDHATPGLPALPTLPPGFTLRLTPRPDRNTLDVELHLVGPEADLTKELGIARSWAGIDGFSSLRGIVVRDERGEITTRQTPQTPDEGPDRLLVLDRAPERSHLVVRYSATSAPPDAARYAVHLDRERLSGVGFTFLLLPRVDATLPTRIELRPGSLAPGALGASSFGVGETIDTQASAADLAAAVYVAGRLRLLERSAPANDDRLVILGRPSFDAESVQTRMARLKLVLNRFFPGVLPNDDVESKGFTSIIMAEPGLGKGHDGALLGRSLGLWVAEDRAFDAPLLIASAHELGHRVIGHSVRLVSDHGEEQVWFSEGFAVHYARKIALAEGLISPAEFADDLERTLPRTAPAIPGHERTREAYQKGALYAAMLDSAVKKASQGARSLDDLMRELTTRAQADKKKDLSVDVFRELVTRELGASRGEELDWVMVKGHGEISIESDAFGPCFERAKRRTKIFDMGFEPASLRGNPAMIRGLVKGSPADRAGLENGMIVISSKTPTSHEPDPKQRVEVVVAGRHGSKKIRFAPVAEREEIRWTSKGSCRKKGAR